MRTPRDKLKPRNITRRSAHLAEMIVHKNLSLIHKKVKGGESLARHEGQFAIDALKLVRAAEKAGAGSEKEGDWNPELLREKLRAAVVEGGKEAAS